MLESIKYVLNNENGGPNLEQIMGLGISSIIMAGVWVVGRSLYAYYYTTPTIQTVDANSVNYIVIGYNP